MIDVCELAQLTREARDAGRPPTPAIGELVTVVGVADADYWHKPDGSLAEGDGYTPEAYIGLTGRVVRHTDTDNPEHTMCMVDLETGEIDGFFPEELQVF